MRWGRWWLIVAFLGAAARAHAGLVLIDGFELTDTLGTSPLCEDGSCASVWSETLGGTAVTGDLALCTQSASCVVHASVNGGAATSKHSAKLSIASGETAYYSLGSSVTLNESQYADHVCVYATGKPTTATRIHEHREGANLGCYVQLNTDGTLTVKDGTGNTFGSTSGIQETSYCASSSNDCTADQDCLDAGKGDVCVSSKCQNIRVPCHDNTPCPSGQTCVGCTTSTGAGCYFGCHELITTSGGTTRLCELALDGTLVVTGAPQTASSSSVTNVRIGATTDPGASGLTAYFDDYVGIGSADRTHMSYVERQCPSSDGTSLDWNQNCAGTDHYLCIDDYCESTFVLNTDDNRRNKTTKVDDFDAMTPTLAGNNVTITGVDIAWVGKQSAADAYIMSLAPMLCPGGTCTSAIPSIEASGTGSTTSRVVIRGTYDETGIAGSQNWTVGRLNQMGATMATLTGNAARNDVQALIVQSAFQRPDAPSPITLCQNDGDTSDIEDHNYGTNDGRCVVAAIGDSTAFGTLAVACQNSTSQEQCSQADYASWDSTERDKPVGGCHGDDALVQTCHNGATSRVEDFNGGAGLPCGPNNGNVSCDQCGSSTDDAVTGGCCVAGVCDGAAEISCTVDADCVLGDCSNCTDGDCTAQTPTETCELSCPGSGTACTSNSQCSGGEKCNTDHSVCAGTCPTDRASWPSYLPQVLSADLILQCGQPAETLASMVENRLASIETTGQISAAGGTGPCIAVQGTGQCECASASDCDGGDTCTNGRCAGTGARTACTEEDNCATNMRCLFYPPDYIVVHEGYNDFYQLSGGTASCTGPQSLNQQQASLVCDNCPTLRCIADSTCTALRSASSECAGHVKGTFGNGPDYPCNVNRVADLFGAASTCLLRSNACRTAADCEAPPTITGSQTCDGYSGGDTADGWCDCGADDASPATNCPTGYSCKNGRCRLACTADGDCGVDGSCSSNVCQGMCTCPSNSSDQDAAGYPNAEACTKDADCPGFGICSGGSCICGGAPICFEAGDACRIPALRRWNSTAGMRNAQAPGGLDHYPYWVRKANDLIDRPADSDGRPLLIFSSLLVSDLERPECAEGIEGEGIRPKWAYHRFRKQLASMLAFPHYVDPFLTFANNPQDDLFVDRVHPGTVGAQLLGQTSIGAFLNSLNVCAQNAGTEKATAQMYCKTTAGTFQSTICSTLADCAAGQVCERRPCNASGNCPNATDSCNLETGAL